MVLQNVFNDNNSYKIFNLQVIRSSVLGISDDISGTFKNPPRTTTTHTHQQEDSERLKHRILMTETEHNLKRTQTNNNLAPNFGEPRLKYSTE